MIDRFVVVPAAYVYLLREGGEGTEVLLQLRRGTGYMDGHWAAGAAGHVERGETAPEAAHREVREELGIELRDLAFELTMHRTARATPVDERVDFFFSSRAWSGEPRVVETDKAAELRWWPLADLPTPTVPHEAVALAHLGRGTGYLAHGFEG